MRYRVGTVQADPQPHRVIVRGRSDTGEVITVTMLRDGMPRPGQYLDIEVTGQPSPPPSSTPPDYRMERF